MQRQRRRRSKRIWYVILGVFIAVFLFSFLAQRFKNDSEVDAKSGDEKKAADNKSDAQEKTADNTDDPENADNKMDDQEKDETKTDDQE